jgi:carbon-monoxide dehydrogenase medium subunit/6-hydroxypseudooxynicotine dehydrogenase subunit alpha
VKPARFDYAAPASVEEAVALLGELGEDAKVLAGGQSLVPLMNFRLARPATIVDVNRIDALAYVREVDGGGLAVGALTRQSELEGSEVASSRFPVLVDALRLVGHAQIRNRGTVGGSVAHADPAAELPCVLTALDARFVLASATGRREVGASELFVDVFTTAIAAEELLVEVRIPPMPAGGHAFLEFARRAGDFALGGACALLGVGPDGRCEWARLALLAAGPRPVRAAAAEQALVGSQLAATDVDAAVEAAARDVSPSGDMHGSAEYRTDLLRVMARRALETAARRATAPEGARPTGRGGNAPGSGAPGTTEAGVPASPAGTAPPGTASPAAAHSEPPAPETAQGETTPEPGPPTPEAAQQPAGQPAPDQPDPSAAPPPPSGGRAQDLAGPGDASTQGVNAGQVHVDVTVNGTLLRAGVEPRKTLADFIREEAGLTGTHLGCEHGVCGACTIQLDGQPVRSCLLFAVQANGHHVRTVESLAPDPDGELHPLQQAFHETHALQCGFCTPGFLMTLEAYLREPPNPAPTEEDIREVLSGNLCRCTGYQNIVEAVRLAARRSRLG